MGEVRQRPGAGELVADLRRRLVARIAPAVARAPDLGLVLDAQDRVGEGVVALLVESYLDGPVLGGRRSSCTGETSSLLPFPAAGEEVIESVWCGG
jgi:hypothetical protein